VSPSSSSVAWHNIFAHRESSREEEESIVDNFGRTFYHRKSLTLSLFWGLLRAAGNAEGQKRERKLDNYDFSIQGIFYHRLIKKERRKLFTAFLCDVGVAPLSLYSLPLSSPFVLECDHIFMAYVYTLLCKRIFFLPFIGPNECDT
jgi:hypothetical protein